jgi:hypothetical protein
MSSCTDTTPAPHGGDGVVFAPDIDQLARHTVESAVRAAALILPFDDITPAALHALLLDDYATLAPIYDTHQLYEIEGLVNVFVQIVRDERRVMVTEPLFAIVRQIASEWPPGVDLTLENAIIALPTAHPFVCRALSSSFRQRECRAAVERFVATTPAAAAPLPVSSLIHQVKTYYTYFCMTYPLAEFTERALLSLALDADDARRGKFLPQRLLPPDFFAAYAAASFVEQNAWFTMFVTTNTVRAARCSFIAPAFSIIFPAMMLAVERRTFTYERAVAWYLSFSVISARYTPLTVLAQVMRIVAYFDGHDAEHWVNPALEAALLTGAPTKGLHKFNSPGMRTIVRQYIKLKMKRK